jgi:DNA-directed RNA polymerase specialized sigma24 family protein
VREERLRGSALLDDEDAMDRLSEAERAVLELVAIDELGAR